MSSDRVVDTHKGKPRVVCLGEPKYVGKEYLEEFSRHFDFEILEAYNHKEVKEKLPALVATGGPIDAFIVRMGTPPYEPFDEDFFRPLLPSCRIIVSASAGYNEFDTEWMAKNGIIFCNSVDAVAEATADMAMFLTLAVLKNTSNAERSARAGRWKQNLVPTIDPTNLTLGIVGMGAIGKYLAKKAAVFNLKVIYHNRHQLSRETEQRYGATFCSSMDELLSASDIVSINCPLNAETTNLIGKEQFNNMKDGVYLINTSRGAVIDEAALKEALESGKVARAGLDVLCNEPNVDPWFLQHDNVIVQPHLGGLTTVAFQKAERECFANIKALFEHGKANSPVNMASLRQ